VRYGLGMCLSAVLAGLLALGAVRLFQHDDPRAWLRLVGAGTALAAAGLCGRRRPWGPASVQVLLWVIAALVVSLNWCVNPPPEGWREPGVFGLLFALLAGAELPHNCSAAHLWVAGGFFVIGALIGPLGSRIVRWGYQAGGTTSE